MGSRVEAMVVGKRLIRSFRSEGTERNIANASIRIYVPGAGGGWAISRPAMATMNSAKSNEMPCIGTPECRGEGG